LALQIVDEQVDQGVGKAAPDNHPKRGEVGPVIR
jgi:hypothetical protein